MLGCYSSTAVQQQKRRDFRTLRSPFTSDRRRAPALDVDTPMLERCKEFGWSTLNRSLPSHLPTSLICHFPLPAALLYLFPYHMYPLPYSILPSPLPVPKYEETVLHNSLDSSNALPKASRHLAKSLTKLLWLHHRQMMSADYFVRKRPPYKEPARKDTLAYWLIICIICIRGHMFCSFLTFCPLKSSDYKWHDTLTCYNAYRNTLATRVYWKQPRPNASHWSISACRGN